MCAVRVFARSPAMEMSDISPWPSTSHLSQHASQTGDLTSSPHRRASVRHGAPASGAESGSAFEIVDAHRSAGSAHDAMASSTDSLVLGQPPRHMHNRQPPPLKLPLERTKDGAGQDMKAGMSPWPSATSLSSSTPARDQMPAAAAGHVRNVQAELEQAAMRASSAYQPFSPLIQAGGAAQGRAAGREDTGGTGEPAANTPRQVHNDGGQSAVADRAADTGLRLRQSSRSPRRSPRNSRFSPPRNGEQGGQVGAWIANLSELLTSSLTGTIKEAASALEKALKTREGREALLARQHGVTRLMACLSNEDDDEEERKSVVRCGSRALAALSMDSRGRRGIIHVMGASSGSLVRMSQLLRCNDVETAQCMSLIVGNLVRAPWGPFAIDRERERERQHTHTHTHTHTRSEYVLELASETDAAWVYDIQSVCKCVRPPGNVVPGRVCVGSRKVWTGPGSVVPRRDRKPHGPGMVQGPQDPTIHNWCKPSLFSVARPRMTVCVPCGVLRCASRACLSLSAALLGRKMQSQAEARIVPVRGRSPAQPVGGSCRGRAAQKV